jgi:hypothetical protein
MMLAPHLRMVVWPHNFQPHVPKKYDEMVNSTEFLQMYSTEFLQMYSTSILTTEEDEVVMTNYFPVAMTNEDITPMDTNNTPQVDIQCPITHAHARQLNL